MSAAAPASRDPRASNERVRAAAEAGLTGRSFRWRERDWEVSYDGTHVLVYGDDWEVPSAMAEDLGTSYKGAPADPARPETVGFWIVELPQGNRPAGC